MIASFFKAVRVRDCPAIDVLVGSGEEVVVTLMAFISTLSHDLMQEDYEFFIWESIIVILSERSPK